MTKADIFQLTNAIHLQSKKPLLYFSCLNNCFQGINLLYRRNIMANKEQHKESKGKAKKAPAKKK